MTISNKATLAAAITTLFADNASGDVTPAVMRGYLTDILDSGRIQRTETILNSDVNVTFVESDVDDNKLHILNPAPSIDQILTLPVITSDMVGRTLVIYLDYSGSQLTLDPTGGDSIIGRAFIITEQTFLGIRVLDNSRWMVQSFALGSRGPDTVLNAESFAVQAPAGLDSVLQVEFGAAQSNNTISLSVTGTMTFHHVGVYNVKNVFNFTRPISAGEAYFFLRVLRDGVQFGNAIAVLQTDDDITIPIIVENIIGVSVGDLEVPFTVECIRDGQGGAGNNSGQLSGLTSTNGWGQTPSARLVVDRF